MIFNMAFLLLRHACTIMITLRVSYFTQFSSNHNEEGRCNNCCQGDQAVGGG